MLPQDEFTPHGYLDNPYHSWRLNPSGVLRSSPPLGMGWHVPNFGSYARNQFQYTAHLQIGLKIGKDILITSDDFKRHRCQITSHLHTKNRFEYACFIPHYQITLTARYFLINEHALGCILTLSASASLQATLPITCFIIHQHTHNPHTSRYWEHGLYAINGPVEGTCLLGIASEGDAFAHGVRAADGGALTCKPFYLVQTLEEVALVAQGVSVAPPVVTASDPQTGWQKRILVQPCELSLPGNSYSQERILNIVLTRGVSQDQSSERWLDAIEKIARAEADHRQDDEAFWRYAPQLTGSWPDYWRRGLVYDLETLRMVIRPSVGVIGHYFDGMQIQAPRMVLAEAAMDALFLSYADPKLAAEVILCHFESAPQPQVPCMREDGSYNMVADDGQVCGTAPEWGFPLWCCEQIFLRTGDLNWLRRLYQPAAAYIRWWLDHRRNEKGWMVFDCSWESGQDVSRRFGEQQTGGTIIQHVLPVDLQASMAQASTILTQWATRLANASKSELPNENFASEIASWSAIAEEFTIKTHAMWQDNWFRDYDSVTHEWSTVPDTMHLVPIFCGIATPEQIEQLRPALAQPPQHSGWSPLSWPPVVLPFIEAVAGARMPSETAEFAYQFIEAAYHDLDRRDVDEHGAIPGITREYHASVQRGKWNKLEYVNAGIEGYGWGALSIHLLIRFIWGLQPRDVDQLILAPCFPQALRRVGAIYRLQALPWGKMLLNLECRIVDEQRYHLQIQCVTRSLSEPENLLDIVPTNPDNNLQPETSSRLATREWESSWGTVHVLQIPLN